MGSRARSLLSLRKRLRFLTSIMGLGLSISIQSPSNSMSSPSRVSPRKSKPTIREVSRRAGVSTATVSRVLSGLGGASEATKLRIEQAVKELGYQRNRMASGLRSTRSTLVGVVIPDLQNPFFTGIVAGIEKVLHERGYTLFLANSDSDPEREHAELQMLQSERVCGILIIPCGVAGEAYCELVESNLPMVAIDRVPEGLPVDSVTVANEKGTFEAVSRLVQAGFSEVGMVNGPDSIGVARDRRRGFVRALEESGVEVRHEWVDTGDFRSESGYESALRVLGQTDRPRALFLGNFLMALGALRAVRELGLSVPEDVALLAFDDMPWATAMNPPLSTVAQPMGEMGQKAAELLLDRLADPGREICHVILDTNLIVRESCGISGGVG